MEIPRLDSIPNEDRIKPVRPVDRVEMGNVLSKLKEDKSTLPEKQKDPKRFKAELYEKG